MTASAPRAPGFSIVELLLVAFILGVGLLGIGAMQVAAVRGGGGGHARMIALGLANNALEQVQAEGRAQLLDRDAPPPPFRSSLDGPGTWLATYDREGAACGPGAPFFTVTVTREAVAAGAGRQGRFQASVAWLEPDQAAGNRPRTLAVARHVGF